MLLLQLSTIYNTNKHSFWSNLMDIKLQALKINGCMSNLQKLLLDCSMTIFIS